MSKIIIAILIIIVIAGAGYWIYQSTLMPTPEGGKECVNDNDCIVFGKTGDCNCGCYNKNNLPSGTGGECFCLAPTSCKCLSGKCEGVFDETTDWETYRNEECGFEIRYPERYETETNCYGYHSYNELLCFAFPSERGIFISVAVERSIKNLSPRPAHSQYEYSFDREDRILSQDVELGGIDFRKDYYAAPVGRSGSTESWEAVIYTYTEHQGSDYILALWHSFSYKREKSEITDEDIINTILREVTDEEDKYVKTLNQILSTFKFLD